MAKSNGNMTQVNWAKDPTSLTEALQPTEDTMIVPYPMILTVGSAAGTLKQENCYGSSPVTITLLITLWRWLTAKSMQANVTDQLGQ